MRKYLCSEKEMDEWNKPSEDIINAENIKHFKRQNKRRERLRNRTYECETPTRNGSVGHPQVIAYW